MRGIAILMVIFTHLRLGPIFAVLPEPLQLLLSLVANNGGVGVSILFLLSGYLMMTLYPVVPVALNFWQKRYTRIFPAFLAMTVVMGLARSGWQTLPWSTVVGLWAVVLVAAGFIWSSVRRSSQRAILGRSIFIGFLTIQILAGVGYVVLQQVVPAAVFLQLWPAWAQQVVGWIINATMSLPYGTYIAQLDGVYWSVCAEVTFYLLYPRVFLPLFRAVVRRRSWLLNVTVLLLVWPFLYGLQQAARGVFGLQLLQLHLAVFFVLGMTVSYFERSELGLSAKLWLTKLPQGLLGLLAFVSLVASPLVWRFIKLPSGVDTMVWAIPLAVSFGITLMIGGWWRRLLETKFLVILGTVSYALYLTHTLAIELAVRTGEPNTLWTALVALINSVLLMAPFAALVHVFLERPYMFDKIASSPRENPKQPIQSKSVMTYLKTWWQTPQLVMIVALIGVGGLIWQSNRVPVTLLAPIAEHHRPDFARQTLLDHVNPVRFEFTASHDALGMILLHIRPLSESEQQALGARRTGGETLAALRVTIRLGEQVIQQSEYPLYQIYQARFFMIGLPVQPESGGKTYDVELSITDPLANKSLALINEETLLRSVYFPNKAEYFRRPQALIQLITSKLVQPFTTHAGQLQLALTLPLLALLWFATWSGK